MGDVKDGKPRFASLKKGQSVFSITLSEALELFKTSLPITLGEIDGKEVVIGEGKYGPYVRYDKTYISIPRGKDPFSVTLDDAAALIRQKKEADIPIHQWGDIQVLNGRYGAYIHTTEGNYQIAKSLNPEALTEEEVREIIAKNEPLTSGKRFFRRKR
jgi:DNA topoisomerase-1